MEVRFLLGMRTFFFIRSAHIGATRFDGTNEISRGTGKRFVETVEQRERFRKEIGR